MADQYLDLQSKIVAHVAGFPGRPFALLDGAKFTDLPRRMKAGGLFARSLFLDAADAEIQKAGPWLVALDQSPAAASHVVSLVGDLPAAVFWSCAAGEAVLHRHLRTLNMVRIPTSAATGAADAEPGTTSVVMFRHWDPRVVGAVLPTFDAGQFARFCGPAEKLVFVTEDGRIARIERDDAWPPPRPGMLQLSEAQIAALSANRSAASRRKIVDYLHRTASRQTAGLSEDQLADMVVRSELSGDALGLHTERAHGKWAYLNVAYAHDRAALERFRAFIAANQKRPERQLGRLYTSLILEASARETT